MLKDKSISSEESQLLKDEYWRLIGGLSKKNMIFMILIYQKMNLYQRHEKRI